MSKEKRTEDLKTRVELLEKELLNLNGRKRAEARTQYLKLLRSCGKEFGLEDPIYLMRC